MMKSPQQKEKDFIEKFYSKVLYHHLSIYFGQYSRAKESCTCTSCFQVQIRLHCGGYFIQAPISCAMVTVQQQQGPSI